MRTEKQLAKKTEEQEEEDYGQKTTATPAWPILDSALLLRRRKRSSRADSITERGERERESRKSEKR
ncbi:hypothetical protein CDL15_Pgr028448 [Punica granatum]|uniref:Uncharacterized protein n=1 Tax=Punica granatum TaxID=22663 RepID=A0A218W6G3_PUNGR|nr:hypothetical protein CDL15_Pgr028448 [Punica granatum]